jgi:hypothetical protein
VDLLFLDESGKIGESGLFALGGVAVRDRDWGALRHCWQETLAAHRWPLERELKWHGIRTGSVPPALADAVFETLSLAPVRCYVALLDLVEGPRVEPEYFRSEDDIYGTALMFLAERFEHQLIAEDELGLIVVDSRWRERDGRLRRFFADLTEEGTPYMRFDRMVEGLFLGPSHYSIGLQCADLVVAATAAAERGIGLARRYLKQLLPRFAVHPATGELEGVGIKRFPEAVPRAHEAHRLF